MAGMDRDVLRGPVHTHGKEVSLSGLCDRYAGQMRLGVQFSFELAVIGVPRVAGGVPVGQAEQLADVDVQPRAVHTPSSHSPLMPEGCFEGVHGCADNGIAHQPPLPI
ncbi:hypothetical protein D9M71_746060 [compost metagenome]